MKPPTDNDSNAIALSLRKGEPAAVEKLRERVRKIVSYRGYRIPVEDRRDLVQEVTTQVWQAVNSPGFQPEPHFWRFVEVVSCRRCIDWYRTQKASTSFDPETPGSEATPFETAWFRQRRHLASQAIDQLGESCQELIRLHVVLEKSYREISRLLGRSNGSLRVQMYRCVQELRRIIERLSGGEVNQRPGKS